MIYCGHNYADQPTDTLGNKNQLVFVVQDEATLFENAWELGLNSNNPINSKNS